MNSSVSQLNRIVLMVMTQVMVNMNSSPIYVPKTLQSRIQHGVFGLKLTKSSNQRIRADTPHAQLNKNILFEHNGAIKMVHRGASVWGNFVRVAHDSNFPCPWSLTKADTLASGVPQEKAEVGPLVVQQTVWAHLENRHDLLLNSTWVTAFHAKRTIAVLTGPVIAGFCSLGSSHWVILLSVNNRRNYIITSRLSHHEFMVLVFFCFVFPTDVFPTISTT